MDIEGASGQEIRLLLVDMMGPILVDRPIKVTETIHREPASLGHHEPGSYLLRVSTSTQTKTLKVLKQEGEIASLLHRV